VKVDDFVSLSVVLEAVLIVAGATAGSYAWTPYPLGSLIGAGIGLGVAYILVEILDRLYLIYGDPERIGRELEERVVGGARRNAGGRSEARTSQGRREWERVGRSPEARAPAT
jgi:hypothetical protein